MTAQELIAKVLELEEGVCHSCRQHKYLATAKKFAHMLQKAIEQRDEYIFQSVRDAPGALPSEVEDDIKFEVGCCNIELDRIAKGEE